MYINDLLFGDVFQNVNWNYTIKKPDKRWKKPETWYAKEKFYILVA